MTASLAIVLLVAFDQMYGASNRLSETLGRGSGLSGRTEIWRVVIEKNRDSLVGAGFRGFWETSEGESAWREIGMGELVSAHNGYLETYLNGGLAGLILLGALLWATGRNATDKLIAGELIGRLAVVFWPILLVYNITESQYFQGGSLWFTALLVLIDSRWQHRPPTLPRPFSVRHSRPGPSVDAVRPVDAQTRPRVRWRTASRFPTAPTGITFLS
jgi:O-antigen ligase